MVKRRDPVRPTWAVGSRRDTVVVYLIIALVNFMIMAMMIFMMFHDDDGWSC